MVHFSRQNRLTITGYLYAFAAQISFVVVAALVYFPDLRGGLVSINLDSADAVESVSLNALEIEPKTEENALESETLEAEEADFSEFELENVVDADWQPLQSAPTGASSVEDISDAQFVSKSKSGFFGIKPVGDRIIYIIDMSVSMDSRRRIKTENDVSRWDRAVEELLSSVRQLREDQEFYIYLFCFEKEELFLGQRGVFSKPTQKNIQRLEQKLEKIKLGAGTDPRECIANALNKNPTCVFLLSDGEFNGHLYRRAKYKQTPQVIVRQHNKNNCPIHTIGLEDQRNQKTMISISEESGGMYRFIPK